MSQATAVRTATTPAPRPGSRSATPIPRLRVVSAPARERSRAGLVMLCLALLVCGLLSILVLNLSLERGSYVLAKQKAEISRMRDDNQLRTEELSSQRAPDQLAKKATKLGMVPNERAVFLREGDGKVLGAPTLAVALPSPNVTKSAAPGTASSSSSSAKAATKKTPAPKASHLSRTSSLKPTARH
jgi:hypothetical protein